MALFNIDSFKKSTTLAWPISLQSILVTLLGMIDIIMVGHLGDSSVAAVGIGNRVQFVILLVVTGLATGVGVLSAQNFGAGKIKQIRKTVVMAILLAITVLIPIVLLNFYFSEDIIHLASNDYAVISQGSTYLWITMPSLFFIAVILTFENAMRGIGQVKLPMLFSVIAILINIVLNYWLINGGLGVEPMGVAGAAWATSLSRLLHMMMLIVFLGKAKHLVYPGDIVLSDLNKLPEWLKFIKMAWPMMVSFGVWSLGTFVYQLIYGQMGTKELAVMSLLAPVEGMFISFFYGFSASCSIMVGQRLGRSEFNEAWNIAKGFAISAPIVTFFLALLAFQFETWIFKPYLSMPPETIALAHEVFILITFGTCIKVFNMTLSLGVLRAGGDNTFCLFIDTVGMWVVSIPLTFISAFYFGLPLFWVVFTAYSEEICKIFLFATRMRSKRWLRNLTLDDHQTTERVSSPEK